MSHRWLFGAVIVASFVGVSDAAWSQESDPGTGQARIQLGVEYAVPKVDGETYDQHTFETPTVLLLQGLDRAQNYTFSLVPGTDQYEPGELIIEPKCWKLKKVGKNLKAWTCEKVVKFKKASKKPATAPAPAPVPAPPDDVPPMPPDVPPVPPEAPPAPPTPQP